MKKNLMPWVVDKLWFSGALNGAKYNNSNKSARWAKLRKLVGLPARHKKAMNMDSSWKATQGFSWSRQWVTASSRSRLLAWNMDDLVWQPIRSCQNSTLIKSITLKPFQLSLKVSILTASSRTITNRYWENWVHRWDPKI